MATLGHPWIGRDGQLSSLRSMARRQESASRMTSGIVSAGLFVGNLFACGMCEHLLLEESRAAGYFFLVETVVMLMLLVSHGSLALQSILLRAALNGVARRRRFIFLVTEFIIHRNAVALVASLLLAWSILFAAHPEHLALLWLSTMVWWTGGILVSASVLLFSLRRNLSPQFLMTGLLLALFVVLTGPAVLRGASPILEIPLAGWMARSFSSVVEGRIFSALLWLLPNLGLSILCTLPGVSVR
jgi:hypothetical protein